MKVIDELVIKVFSLESYVVANFQQLLEERSALRKELELTK
jgi:hypothetical protein